jgi:uncharacterized protein YkwD
LRLAGPSAIVLHLLKHVLSALAATMLVVPPAASAGLSRAESAVLQEMNHVRAQHGLASLHYQAQLQRAARARTVTR